MEIISSERLAIRTTKESDILLLHERIFSVPEVIKYVFGGKSFSSTESEAFIREKFNFQVSKTGLFSLVEKASRRVIGFAGIIPCTHLGQDDFEFGYVLEKNSWGKGYATEIGKAQIEYVFQNLDCHRILALVNPQNTPSIHVLNKLQMKYETDVMVDGRGLRRVYLRNSISKCHYIN